MQFVALYDRKTGPMTKLEFLKRWLEIILEDQWKTENHKNIVEWKRKWTCRDKDGSTMAKKMLL